MTLLGWWFYFMIMLGGVWGLLWFWGMDKRGEGRKKWVEAHGMKAVPTMKRRMEGHDYCGVCMYMVTISVADRRPLLGSLHCCYAWYVNVWRDGVSQQFSALGTRGQPPHFVKCWTTWPLGRLLEGQSSAIVGEAPPSGLVYCQTWDNHWTVGSLLR